MTKVSAGAHLKELRTRFFIVAIFFIIGACLAYYFQNQVLTAVLAPLHGQKLVYLTAGGGFNFIFMVSIYAGLALAIPILIQQLYAFVRPALPATAQKKSSSLIIGSLLLLTAGILFGYFVAVPNSLIFLMQFAGAWVDSMLTAESYLNFVMAYTIGIGLVFQIPLLLLLINTVKPLTPGGLMKSEKWVLLISVILAAIITPTPDPINQLIIAGPIIIVYQIGVVIILTQIHKKYRANKKLEKQAAKAKAKQTRAPQPKHEPKPVPAPQYVPKPQFQAARPVAKQVIKPAQPKLIKPVAPILNQQAKPALHLQQQPTGPRPIDGFVRPARPAVQPITVPKREEPKAQPVVRAIPRTPSPTQRNFTIDGMYRPFYPNQAA